MLLQLSPTRCRPASSLSAHSSFRTTLCLQPLSTPAGYCNYCCLQISAALLGDAASSVDGDVLRRLKADVAMELNALRNAAYAGGFSAAKGAMDAALKGHYA